jgi:hypothetical protein
MNLKALAKNRKGTNKLMELTTAERGRKDIE